MKEKFLTVVFLLMFYIASASKMNNQNEDAYNENIYRKYVNMDKQLKKLAEKSVKNLLPYLLEAQEHLNISSKCSSNLFYLLNGFRKLSNWSFTLLDASGKLPSGLQIGNVQMNGEYEECVEAIVLKKEKIELQGQYCQILLKPFLPKVKKIPDLYHRFEGLVNATKNSSELMRLLVSRVHVFHEMHINMDLCLPSGCSKQDISNILNYTTGDYINATVKNCLKKGNLFFWTNKRIVIVCFFVLLGLIVITSTCLDNYLGSWTYEEIGTTSKILRCFSLKRNFPKLINTRVSEKSITCFYGIRTLTIFWIVLGHEYFVYATLLYGNHMIHYEKVIKRFFSQIILNGFVSVDVFFFISGFVNCYTRISIKEEGKQQPSIIKMILHRLWRIYPGLFIAFLINHLLNKDQPTVFNYIDQWNKACELYWWRNFLFINNFFDPNELCMPQSWYISTDMQLFLLSLFTIPILLKSPKKGFVLHICIYLTVSLCYMSLWWIYDIGPSTLDAKSLAYNESVQVFRIYVLPVVHTGPYFIGILLAYTINLKKTFHISKVAEIFGWLVASLFFISMLFMTFKWNSGFPYTRLESALYGVFSKTIAILGFSWLVFCCVTGRAGLINYILSLKLWIPLSRITYMLYLISIIIQYHHPRHLSFPMDFSDITIIWKYFGDLSISMLMSFSLVLIAESPFIAMEKILFGRNRNDKKTLTELGNQFKMNNDEENRFHSTGKITTLHL